MTRQIKVIQGKLPKNDYWKDWKVKILEGIEALRFLKRQKGWKSLDIDSDEDFRVTIWKKRGR